MTCYTLLISVFEKYHSKLKSKQTLKSIYGNFYLYSCSRMEAVFRVDEQILRNDTYPDLNEITFFCFGQ